MSGKILGAARKDFSKITSSGGFQEEITLSNPSNNTQITFNNVHTKHHLGFDTEGLRVNSKSAHINILMEVLDTANYVYRSPRTGEVDLKGHRVSVKDFSSVKNYVINEFYPSDTFGCIVCILGDFKL